MLKGAKATCVEIVTEMLYIKRHAQFQCSLKCLARINMFQQHYLGNKKPNLLACTLEQVYAAIL